MAINPISLKSLVGLTSAGGINHIGNSNAETDTSGYATYADAAGSSPVDGTGGSASVSWVRSTTSPLRDTAEFLFTKDAVNRQGEGVSYDFTIDAADKAKVLTVTFDYAIASGTYSSGDLTVYLYDVTNAQVIQPAGYQIQSAAQDLPIKHIATFQTASNSTSYRLIFHVASTSSSAYTVKFDNISVGPQVVQYGPPVTYMGSISYSPTITATTTSPTLGTGYVNSAKCRRVGDKLECEWYLDSGNGGNAAGSGTYLISLPSEAPTIDTGKLGAGPSGKAKVGDAFIHNGSEHMEGSVLVYDSTHLMITGLYQAGHGDWGSAFYALSNTNQLHRIKFSVPISGWSSSVQMSNDTDTRVVAAAYTGTSDTSVAASTEETVLYSTKVVDTHSAFNTSTGIYTVPVPGKYRVTAQVAEIDGGAAVPRALKIIQGVTTKYIGGFDNGVSGVTNRPMVSGILECVAGDTIKVNYQNGYAGGAATLANDTNTYVLIERLSGPASITATETVAARYTSHSGQSIPNGAWAILNMDTKEYDTHGAVTTGASWKFAAPIAGKYRVSAAVAIDGLTLGTGEAILEVFKNGASYARGSRIHVGNFPLIGPTISTTVPMNAGDYVDVRVYQSNGATRALETLTDVNWVAIERIGN